MNTIIDEAGRIGLPTHFIEHYNLRDGQWILLRFAPDMHGLRLEPAPDFANSDAAALHPASPPAGTPREDWVYRRTFAEGDKNIVLPATMLAELGWTWGTTLVLHDDADLHTLRCTDCAK